jgi:3-oxoacyl-[acyl-carrier protein] reductase
MMNVKNAVITGGSGGLGKGCIANLKNNGWRTISVDIKPSGSCNPEERPDLEIIADVSDSGAVQNAFDSIMEYCVAPDALICLAGIVLDAAVFGIARGGIHTYPEQSWRKTMDVNLTGTFLCAREFVDRLVRKRHHGVVVTCSSPAANGAPGQSAYAASKAGVEAFTVSLARETAPFGIRVCGFRPALTLTPMAEQYPRHIIDSLASKSLIKRFARPEEIGEAIHFLLGNELASGRIFEFDGGLII